MANNINNNNNSSKIKVVSPLSNSYLTTFINHIINVNFLMDKSAIETDKIKSILFPVDYSDSNFNILNIFITKVLKSKIEKNENLHQIKSSLEAENVIKNLLFIKNLV